MRARQLTGAVQHHGDWGSHRLSPRRDSGMKFAKRAVAGLSGTVLAASALMIVGASPASAATPSGGCWVYSPPTGSDIEDTSPVSSKSTSLAPWADPAASPVGAADYTLTSS